MRPTPEKYSFAPMKTLLLISISFREYCGVRCRASVRVERTGGLEVWQALVVMRAMGVDVLAHGFRGMGVLHAHVLDDEIGETAVAAQLVPVRPHGLQCRPERGAFGLLGDAHRQVEYIRNQLP